MGSAHHLRLLTVVCLLASPLSAEQPKYLDTRLSIDDRVADLLAGMTLEEKVGQMCQKDISALRTQDGRVTPESLADVFAEQSCGTMMCLPGYPPEEIAVRFKAAQDYLRTQTRLGIPAIPIAECLHGVRARGATVFPQAIALGSTWNPELVQEVGAAIAEEASAIGVAQCLAPVLDLARDPRFGRVEECYGECPTLVSNMGVAFITGAQGPNIWQSGLDPHKIMCTAKHFAGYSVPAGGLASGPASIGQREMRSLHLVPFEAAVRQAGVCAVMPSYNEVDGLPSHANHRLLGDILRGDWGFRGYVFSDYGGIHMLYDYHHVAVDAPDAAVQALLAGVDLDAPGATAYRHLAQLVRDGRVQTEAIDRAVERILRIKFLAGLFDGRRQINLARLEEDVHTREHIALARRAAEESIILLKNEGNVLPLDARKLDSIAVIGPNADQVQFGDYSATKDNAYGVTVLDGLRRALGDRVRINYARGCDLVDLSRTSFGQAVEAAGKSDVAVVVIGDTSEITGDLSLGDEAYNRLATVGEAFDTTSLSPPGVQDDLVRAVSATRKPVIVVMIHGRPYSIPWMKANIPGILSVFYPGEQGGNAIADILLGRINPSGRLPVSVPQSAGHIPTVYDYKPTGRGVYRQPGTPEKPGRDYVFTSPDPLYPFGFGLSYTTFAYSDLVIEKPCVTTDGVVRLSFVVSNVGLREGKEVAQVYIRDEVSSTTTPTMRLLRFKKILLEPGGSRRLELDIPVSELAIWDAAMKRVVEPGRFQVMVGASAEDIRLQGVFDVQSEHAGTTPANHRTVDNPNQPAESAMTTQPRGTGSSAGGSLAKPTPEQLAWHDSEIGMFIHFAPNTFTDQEYDDLSLPLTEFNPARLDTDQWVAAADGMGAKYIVFVAKHAGGFCMWPTETTDYSVKNTPWRGGTGDVLRDLSKSCRKRGMKLGVYVSPCDRKQGAEGGGRCSTPEAQAAYNSLYRRQLTEVLSGYGEMYEVWFDGSIVVPVGDILERYAPRAMVFQGPHATIRWVGNEDGIAPYPAWNALTEKDAQSGEATAAHGDPNGLAWLPLECDARIRSTWFWNTKNADTLKTVDELMEMYYQSVGHGAVLLLNQTPDATGLIPDADVRRSAEFAAEVRRRFGRSVAETTGAGDLIELVLPAPARIDHVITMEDISQGERIREYVIEGLVVGKWEPLCRGTAIGRKKIDRFVPTEVTKLRLKVLKSAAQPLITRLAAFSVTPVR